MDFDRDWTSFALDAEVDAYGTARIAQAHNRLRDKIRQLEADVRDLNEHIENQHAAFRQREKLLEARERALADSAMHYTGPVVQADFPKVRAVLLEDHASDPAMQSPAPRLLTIQRTIPCPNGTFDIIVRDPSRKGL